MEDECIILAGGLGTRLQPVVKDVPKCMAPVNGQPFLQYLLQYLSSQNIRKIILSVGFKHEIIIDWCHKNSSGFDIIFAIEKTPLGTGGAIQYALQFVQNQSAFIINGDTYFPVSLKALSTWHQKQHADISIALKPMQHFDRYGSVELTGDRITAFKEKRYLEKGLINGGIYCLNKQALLNGHFPEKFSFESDYLEKQVATQYFAGYVADEYFIDIGVPQDYSRAQKELV